MYHASMQSPTRPQVVTARIILALIVYVPLVALLRLDGRGWYHALFSPAIHLILGYALGTAVALLMIIAAGLPVPWATEGDDHTSRE